MFLERFIFFRREWERKRKKEIREKEKGLLLLRYNNCSDVFIISLYHHVCVNNNNRYLIFAFSASFCSTRGFCQESFQVFHH